MGRLWNEEVLGVPCEEIEVDDDGGGGMILQIAIVGCCRVPEFS